MLTSPATVGRAKLFAAEPAPGFMQATTFDDDLQLDLWRPVTGPLPAREDGRPIRATWRHRNGRRQKLHAISRGLMAPGGRSCPRSICIAMKLFTVWQAERTPTLVLADPVELPARLLEEGEPRLSEGWTPATFRLHRPPRPGVRQDMATWYGRPCLKASHAHALLVNRAGIELLPIRVADEDWLMINVLGTLEGVDLDSSAFHVSAPVELMHRYFEWINLVHALPLPCEFLKLREGGRAQYFVAQPFVDRYNSLQFKGLRFELVGHVISSIDKAIPRPPRATKAQPSAVSRPAAKLQIRSLPKSWHEELRASASNGARRLGLVGCPGPDETLAAIEAEIQRLRPHWSDAVTDDQMGSLMELSAVLGDLVNVRFGWQWMQLTQGRGLNWMAVVSPDGRYALPVAACLHAQLRKTESMLALLLNMIGAQAWPPAAAGQPVLLT